MFDSERAFEYLKELAFERQAGAESERRAAEIIAAHLEEFGLKPHFEEFPLWTFEKGEGWLEVNGRGFPARPYSLTDPFDVEAEIVFVESVDFVRRSDVEGRLAVVYQGVNTKDYFRLMELGVAGIIRISSPHRDIQTGHLSQKAAEEGRIIPVTSVSYEAGMALLNASRAHIYGDFRRIRSKGLNVIADYGDGDEIVLVTAHYDTVAYSPGVSDNGGGTAVLIELARGLAESGRQFRRKVRFIWFSGEELGLVGSFAYQKSHRDELRDIVYQVNVDVVGDALGHNRAIVTACRRAEGYLKRMARRVERKFQSRLGVYSSDSVPFALEGIPSFNLVRGGGLPSMHGHTPDDDLWGAHPRGLEPVLKLASGIVIDMADRPEIPDSLRKINRQVVGELKDYCDRRMFCDTI